MMLFCVRKESMFLIVVLGLYVSNYSFSDELLNDCSFSLEDNIFLKKTDLNLFEKKDIQILGESSEGGFAEIYRKDGVLVAINTIFLGETGKTAINYYFSSTNSKQYLVELTDYHYTVPIYDPDSKIASLNISRFLVCEGEKPNYPGSIDLANVYSRATNTLANICKSVSHQLPCVRQKTELNIKK